MREAVIGYGFGHHPAAVAHVAAAVNRAVAVQELTVPAALGHADAIDGTRYGREVDDGDGEVVRIAGPADERDDTVFVVVAVDPAETARFEIHFVERPLTLIGVIQILDPLLQSRVLRVLEQIPIEA